MASYKNDRHTNAGSRQSLLNFQAIRASGGLPMPADALSNVLRTVRLTGAAFFDVVAKAPWVAEQPGPAMILPKILPGAEHMIAYHVVTEGRCFAGIIGGEPIAVQAGEVIVFTRGDPHVMSSSPGMRADPFAPGVIDAAARGQLPFFINFGGEGPTSAKLVCGFLACDAQPFNPLLENLPPVIKAGDPRDSNAGWVGQMVRQAMMKSTDKRAGGESVLAKLSELMFIEVVRRHLEALPPEQTRVARGSARPLHRQGFVFAARAAGAELDHRGIGEAGRRIALSPCRTLHRPCRHSRRCNTSPNGGCRSRRSFSLVATPR